MILKHEQGALAALADGPKTVEDLMDATGCTSRGSMNRLMQTLFDRDAVRFQYVAVPGHRRPVRGWSLRGSNG